MPRATDQKTRGGVPGHPPGRGHSASKPPAARAAGGAGTHGPGSGEWRPLCRPHPPGPGALAGTPCGSRVGPRRPRPRVLHPALGKGRRCRTLPHTAPATPWPQRSEPDAASSKSGSQQGRLGMRTAFFSRAKSPGRQRHKSRKKGRDHRTALYGGRKMGLGNTVLTCQEVEPGKRLRVLRPREPPSAQEAEVARRTPRPLLWGTQRPALSSPQRAGVGYLLMQGSPN